jgi:hypothetical protein
MSHTELKKARVILLDLMDYTQGLSEDLREVDGISGNRSDFLSMCRVEVEKIDRKIVLERLADV